MIFPSLDLQRASALEASTHRLLASDSLAQAVESIRERRGAGHEFLGWLDLPARATGELRRLHEVSADLRSEIDTLVVVGIGGSYLGTRALLDALRWKYWRASGPRVIYAGHHLEPSFYERLLVELEGREFAVNVISKSGTTTEPAIAFRLLREAMERSYGSKKTARRVVATTDAEHGALLSLAQERGYRRFVVPADVGGRFSVLSPVGLFPLAVAGVDIEELLAGARRQMTHVLEGALDEVAAIRYAAYRHQAYRSGQVTEVLASFHPSLHHLAEWWKQLFGESEGKQGQGLFPAAVEYTTDLHSLGQAMQDGPRTLMETILRVDSGEAGATVPRLGDDRDGLEYLAGRSLESVNRAAVDAVAEAHEEGGIPVAEITLADLGEASLGALIVFFEFACAVSGRMLGVNPFDQPGVEAYKKNLFRRLGRPET